MNKTGISWTDLSSNPLRYETADGEDVWACVKTSPGCKNCYAEAMALQYGKGSAFTAANMRQLTPYIRDKELKDILSPKKTPPGSRVFVGDMTDLFGSWVSDPLLDCLFAAYALRPDVTFQVLTKRPEQMVVYTTDTGTHLRVTRCMVNFREYSEPVGPWPLPNVWMGCSLENADYVSRLDHLRRAEAVVKFLSVEPLLGPIRDLDLTGINWVIMGGESGANHRPMQIEWAADLARQCEAAGVKAFVKQDSGRLPGKQGRLPLELWERKEFPPTEVHG